MNIPGTILTAGPLFATSAILTDKAKRRLLVPAGYSFMLLEKRKESDINDNSSLMWFVHLY